jgi:stalled ribosome alternative rescue factor ArfA
VGLNKEQYTTALYEHVTTSVKKNDMPAFIEDELFKHWQHPEYKK